MCQDLLQGFSMCSPQSAGGHHVLSRRCGEQSCYHAAVHQPGVHDTDLKAAAVVGQAGMPFRGSCSGVHTNLPHRTDSHDLVGNGDADASVNWQVA